jgi:hypothetical protein
MIRTNSTTKAPSQPGVLYDWWPEIAAPTNYHQNGIKAYILHRLNYLAADGQKFGD